MLALQDIPNRHIPPEILLFARLLAVLRPESRILPLAGQEEPCPVSVLPI